MDNFINKNVEILLCQKCNREIPFGKPYYSIVRTLENRIIEQESSEEEINIIESEEITTLCKTCGSYFNIEALDIILKHLPLPGQEVRN